MRVVFYAIFYYYSIAFLFITFYYTYFILLIYNELFQVEDSKCCCWDRIKWCNHCKSAQLCGHKLLGVLCGHCWWSVIDEPLVFICSQIRRQYPAKWRLCPWKGTKRWLAIISAKKVVEEAAYPLLCWLNSSSNGHIMNLLFWLNCKLAISPLALPQGPAKYSFWIDS